LALDFKSFPVLQIKRSKFLVGSNVRRLWYNEDDSNVYVEVKEGDRTDDVKLKHYLSVNVSDEVDTLCKLVLIHQMPLPDVIEGLIKQHGGDELAQANARLCVDEKEFKELAFRLKYAQIQKRMMQS
jgi:hypothetical protein